MSAVKHTPATPLPWIADTHRINDCNGQNIARADNQFGDNIDHVQDAAYIVHAANAYPRLVEALRLCLATDGHGLSTKGELPARALLREFGE